MNGSEKKGGREEGKLEDATCGGGGGKTQKKSTECANAAHTDQEG